MHERSFDAYRQVSALKIVVGDIRLSLTIVRDLAGRTSYNIWRTPTDDFKEIRTFDVQGRLATCEITGKERFLFKYNNDSRIALMNDVSFEWHTGGVPKKAGRTEYAVDGNGWTIKRGDIGFEMDCYGRLVGARGPSIDMKLEYDHQSRLISIRNGAVFYSLFYTLPHLPRSASHFQSSSDSSATTVLYTEEGVPFAMNRDGFRYAIAVDDEGSLRYLLSETGVEKEIHRDPFGRIIIDTQSKFWVPLGFHGGVDIPELSVAILPNGRPYDTVLGRYMSFGPIDLRRINFDDILRSVDPFSLEQPSNAASLTPTDMKTWFRLVGLSPVLLPPADLHLTCQHSVCTRSLSSFPSRLRTFSQLPSLSSIELLDTSFMAMYPSEDIAFAVEDAGFHELLVLTPNGHKASFRILTNWRVFGTSWERHLVRPDDVPSSLTSLSMPHFTLVVSRGTAELRNGKTKIFVHFSSDADTVNKILMEDFRRREGPTVWRAERRRIERGESTQPWTQQEKRLKETIEGNFSQKAPLRGILSKWIIRYGHDSHPCTFGVSSKRPRKAALHLRIEVSCIMSYTQKKQTTDLEKCYSELIKLE
uniref:Tox-GHH domain-containing protein n=1 Tax=Angiostrongylus cantonensis TaxID=6313 RepID=A0A0K0D2X2_ANGCA